MSDRRDEPDRKELLKSAYRKIEALRARLTEAESRDDEPVAVIGMGCRFPGGVEDPESFWRLLSQGLDGTTEIPPDRWSVDDFYDPDPDAPNKMYVRRGGFIDNVRGFDPLFFHVSPLEAASMDPQQRVLLEVAWEAIENAGHAPDQLAGSNTGVFVGMSASDFAVMAVQAMRQNEARAHTATGISPSIAAGHISYFFGLRGPCMAIDTACSSALTAIHLAIESLRKRESSAALAGSVNLILSPDGNIMVCKARMLSPDGRCKTFDAGADGYARSEGCGVLVLKLLSRAQADGDRILAVIRGSACNQDGRTNGITAPNGHAQREVIQAALAAAGVSPNDIDYLETHGTGTSLGDPIEAQALGEVFAPGRPAGRELMLGAVKSNIGHLESTAGMAAISKAILALQKGQIPPNLHFEKPNPHIPWDTLPFSVPTRLTPWRAHGAKRMAGVSAFGFSGTNVHMVLEQAPEPSVRVIVQDRDCHLLTLSAQTPKALSDSAARYIAFFAETPEADLGDVCFTANTGRAHFAHRIAIVARTTEEMKAELEQRVNAPESRQGIGCRAPARPPHLGLVIGKVVAGDIHRRLYAASPAFRSAFDACETAATDLFSIPALSEALSGVPWTAGSNEDVGRRQRVLAFARAYALTAQWLDWGLTPVALAASGAESCVAAVAAGAIGLADAMRLAIDPHLAEHSAVEWSSPKLPVISAVTGQPLSAASLRGFADDEQTEERFDNMVEGMRREGVGLLLRIGGTSPEDEAAHDPDQRALKIVSAGCGDWASLLQTAAALYVSGAPPDWRRFESLWPRRRLALPTYPFQRQECWLNVATPSPAKEPRRKVGHPLLGRRAYAPQFRDEVVFETELSAEAPALLRDHAYCSTVIVAMTTMLDMAISAGRAFLGEDTVLEGVTVEQPLLLPAGHTRLVQTVLTPQAGGGFAFSILSADIDDLDSPAPWRPHCGGAVRSHTAETHPRAVAFVDLLEQYREDADPDSFYDAVAKSGLDYGPAFRPMRDIKRGGEGAFVKLALLPELAASASDYAVHPGLLDGAIQALGLCRAIDDVARDSDDAYMPVGIERFSLSKYGLSEIWCHAALRPRDAGDIDTLVGDVALFAPSGEWIGDIAGVQLRRNAKRQMTRELDERRLANWLYEPRWEALPEMSAAATLTGKWMIVASELYIAAALSQRIRELGGQAILVQPGEGFLRRGPDDYAMRLNSDSDYDELLEAIGSAERVNGVAYFTGASMREEEAGDTPAPARRQARNVLQLVQALARNGFNDLASFALITRGFATPSLGSVFGLTAAAAWGLGRVIAAELPELNCKLYDLEPTLTPSEAAALIVNELAADSPENQVSLARSARSGLRLQRSSENASAGSLLNAAEAAGPVELEIGARGDFRQLRFAPQRIEPPGPREVQLRLLATPLNFRDVLNVLGLYPGDPGGLGVECVGEIVAIGPGVEGFMPGEQVLAIPRRGYCSYANAPVNMVFRRPANLSLPQAATLLVAYLTAAYALNHLGRMVAGNRVLIHAAAGGVGLAAVQLCQRAGAEVFATAGSPTKRDHLRQLGVPHVMDSRSLDFASEIRALVGDQGIDLVLNSVTGPAMAQSLGLVRAGGSFLEIGKTGVFTHEEAKAINPAANHLVIDLLAPFQDTPGLMQDLFGDIVQGLSTGELLPLPHRVFPLREAPMAFRHMAAARHIGKVVVVDRAASAAKAIDPSGSYLITGGLGGLGLTIARALAREGARHILLVGRRPPSAEAQAKIKDIEDLGATVRVGCADVGDRAQLEEAMAENLSPANPLRGVIHAAGLIDDGAILFQDETRFDQVMSPKVDGAWHLHQLTLKMPLDFFVLFSSGAGLFGNPGQSSYAAASVFLDALATARFAAGLPALSIDWGPWAEVGMAARMGERHVKGWSSLGLRGMAPDEGAMILRMLLESDRGGQIAVLPVEPASWRQRAPGRAGNPFLADLAKSPPHASPARAVGRTAEILRQAQPGDKLGIVIGMVSEMVADIFGLPQSYVLAVDQNFTELGMDSLLAIQLSNRLKSTFAIAAPATLAFQRPTAQAIGEYVMETLSTRDGATHPDKPSRPPGAAVRAETASNSQSAGAVLADLDQLSDSDVQKLLETIELGVEPA